MTGPFSNGPRYGGPKTGRPARRSPLSPAKVVKGGTEGRKYLVGRSHGPIGQEIVGNLIKPQSNKLGRMHR